MVALIRTTLCSTIDVRHCIIVIGGTWRGGLKSSPEELFGAHGELRYL